MTKIEPTLKDILESVNEKFNLVFTEFAHVNKQFALLSKNILSLHEDIRDIKESQKADSEILDEVRDTLEAVAKAVDKDAVTIISHERRLKVLEKVK